MTQAPAWADSIESMFSYCSSKCQIDKYYLRFRSAKHNCAIHSSWIVWHQNMILIVVDHAYRSWYVIIVIILKNDPFESLILLNGKKKIGNAPNYI